MRALFRVRLLPGPGVEYVPEPWTNEAVVFKDLFKVGICMPPHPVLAEILQKFRVPLYQLTPNDILQIGKFIWAVSYCGGHLTADVFMMHY